MIETPFISIEGPIGIGKTSLTEKLSTHFEYHQLNEIVEENPFLGKFYDNIDEWSFQTEMFFLCNRFKQLEDIELDYLHKNKPVIADYHISKNMIFSQRTLQPDKLDKYKQIYHILTKNMPKPNMMIYLNARLDTIIQLINQEYIEQLAQDYEIYMNEFEVLQPDIPVIRIDGDELDFIKRQDDLNLIIARIEEQLNKQITTL